MESVTYEVQMVWDPQGLKPQVFADIKTLDDALAIRNQHPEYTKSVIFRNETKIVYSD
jgi:hypothetical protein